MEITKVGTPPAERIWSGRCFTCGTEADAKEPELEITHCQRDGSFGRAQCPVCKTGEMTFYPKRAA